MNFVKNLQINSIEDLFEIIIRNYHYKSREIFPLFETKLKKLISKYAKEKPNILLVKELFSQFKSEFLHHIEMEETKLFPDLLEIDLYLSKKKDVPKNLFFEYSSFSNVQKNEHKDFEHYLSSLFDIYEKLRIKDSLYDEFYKDLKFFIDMNEEHIYLEDVYLNKIINWTK